MLVTNRLLPVGQGQKRDITNLLALPNATFRHLRRVGSFMYLQKLNGYAIVRIWRGCGRVWVLVTNRLGPVGRGQTEDGETAGTSKCDLQTPRASGIFHLAAKSQLLCHRMYMESL